MYNTELNMKDAALVGLDDKVTPSMIDKKYTSCVYFFSAFLAENVMLPTFCSQVWSMLPPSADFHRRPYDYHQFPGEEPCDNDLEEDQEDYNTVTQLQQDLTTELDPIDETVQEFAGGLVLCNYICLPQEEPQEVLGSVTKGLGENQVQEWGGPCEPEELENQQSSDGVTSNE